MTSQKIKDRAKAFCKSIAGFGFEDAKQAIATEIAELKNEYKITSVRTALTEYRKQATKDTKHLYTIADIEQIEIETAYKKQIAMQSNDQKQITNFEDMVSTAIELLDSERVAVVAVALAFLTGRRLAEIFCTAKFAKTKDLQRVHFVGQLKKRDTATGYSIYTLTDFDKIKAALQYIQGKVGVITTETANKRYAKACNQVVYKYFSKYIGNCSVHDLRKAYATIIAHLYKPKNQSLNAFLSENLGHSETDLSTANIYQKYYL